MDCMDVAKSRTRLIDFHFYTYREGTFHWRVEAQRSGQNESFILLEKETMNL